MILQLWIGGDLLKKWATKLSLSIIFKIKFDKLLCFTLYITFRCILYIYYHNINYEDILQITHIFGCVCVNVHKELNFFKKLMILSIELFHNYGTFFICSISFNIFSIQRFFFLFYCFI